MLCVLASHCHFFRLALVGLLCACENCWVSHVLGRDTSLSLVVSLLVRLARDFQLLCQLWTLLSDTSGFLLSKLIMVKVCTQLRNTSNWTYLLCGGFVFLYVLCLLFCGAWYTVLVVRHLESLSSEFESHSFCGVIIAKISPLNFLVSWCFLSLESDLWHLWLISLLFHLLLFSVVKAVKFRQHYGQQRHTSYPFFLPFFPD